MSFAKQNTWILTSFDLHSILIRQTSEKVAYKPDLDYLLVHDRTSHQFGSDTFIPSSLVTKTFKIPSSSLAIVKNNPAS